MTARRRESETKPPSIDPEWLRDFEAAARRSLEHRGIPDLSHRRREAEDRTTTYTSPMKSVADELREIERQELRRMTVSERLALALRLGDDDLDLFSRARNIDRESGSALLRRGRQNGRRPSRCFDAAR